MSHRVGGGVRLGHLVAAHGDRIPPSGGGTLGVRPRLPGPVPSGPLLMQEEAYNPVPTGRAHIGFLTHLRSDGMVFSQSGAWHCPESEMQIDLDDPSSPMRCGYQLGDPALGERWTFRTSKPAYSSRCFLHLGDDSASSTLNSCRTILLM